MSFETTELPEGPPALGAGSAALALGLALAIGALATCILRKRKRFKALEREHGALQQHLHAFVEYTPAAVALVDKDMRYLVASRGWLEQYGLGEASIVGKTHYEVFPTIPERWKELHRRSLSGETLSSERDHFDREDGSKTWVRWRIEPWMTPSGSQGGIIMFCEVIDKQVEYEQKLERALEEASAANQAKTDFLANMSHEIRTPLTAICGYADMIANDLSTDAAAVERSAERVIMSSNHLLSVINDILDVSKIEAGAMTAECIDVDPIQITEEVASIAGARAHHKDVAVRIEYGQQLPERIQSDPTRLRQILLNLCNNAVKFTESGSVTINVTCDANEERLRFAIEDTGCGLTAEQVEKLSRFEAFTQADYSVTRQHGGTGLGLRIANSLAELLGGGIRIESTPGSGSTFTAEVATGDLSGVRVLDSPATVDDCIEESRSADASADNTPAAKPLDGLHILLAEDGPDNQRIIIFFLKKAGARVTLCENGREALETTVSAEGGEIPHLILMDMQMPVLDGYSATRRLRRSGFNRPIIAVTAHAMDGDREKCINAGCDDYLTKPVNRDALLELCRTWAVTVKKKPRAA